MRDGFKCVSLPCGPKLVSGAMVQLVKLPALAMLTSLQSPYHRLTSYHAHTTTAVATKGQAAIGTLVKRHAWGIAMLIILCVVAASLGIAKQWTQPTVLLI